MARPATSRTRPRISTGSPPKAAEAPIIRTCKSARFVLIAAAVAAAVPAHASGDSGEVLNALVRARLAEAGGEPVVALTALATVSSAAPGLPGIRGRMLEQAIEAGDLDAAHDAAQER